MYSINTIKKPVEKELDEFEFHFRKSLNSEVPLLEVITNYIIRRKGKQIRPLFVFLSAKLIAPINKSTYNAATLIELLHTASLIHDDVVDESYERRNHFSINAIWKTKVAVLLGDFFLSRGLLISISEKEYKLLEIVSEAVKEMSEGELLQIQSSKKSLAELDNYFEIIRKKTASLIAACTACGTKSVSEDNELINKMKLFGSYIGMAFQIKDDLLDYQVKGITGKPSNNDIKEKKFTLPLILAMKNSDNSLKGKIIRLVNNNSNNSEKIKEITDFVIKKNGILASEKYMEEYKTKALQILSEFPDNEAKRSLCMLVDFVINRRN
jgi:octaprenyl-diphosphate synthase